MGLIADGADPVWHKDGGDGEAQNPQGSEEEEYDIPTFLRKQAD